MSEVITTCLDDTLRIAGDFIKGLVGGEVIGLAGELASGKTTFVKGAMMQIGYTGYVKSPTFTIMNQYKTERFDVFHFDIYRLGSFEELLMIGFESYIRPDAIVMIEWFDKFNELLPLVDIKIYFEYIDEHSRRIKIVKR